ncbi:sensor histidine kinase [Azospirillum canadense]|uniref:sensor histidine kinase n=1 Tax=Azospirillum canadense TaxID=403962 RepID=UPI002228024A|nr:PAS domain S-box protein [Azospirillum canadense]MCW2239636.1 PAS domain S-box-containing protein [Azospirillum canadense]
MLRVETTEGFGLSGKVTAGTSLRTRLMLLVLACALPLAAFAGVLSYQFVQAQSRILQDQVRERVDALSQAVDRYISETEVSLEVLATSPALQQGDLRSFHAQIMEAVKKRGVGIVLLDTTGQQLVTTNLAFGEPLPRRTDLETLNRVVATGRPQISDLTIAAVQQRPILSVEVPVFVVGRLTYVLAMGITPEALGKVIRSQNFPPEWTVAVRDRKGIIAARSRDAARFIGQPGNPRMTEPSARADEEAWYEAVDLEGRAVYGNFVRSTLTGWSVVVGVPRETVVTPFRSLAGLVAAAAAGVLLVGLLLAARVARGITRPLYRLAELPMRRGPHPAQFVSGIIELDRVASLLATRERERDEALARVRDSEERLRATYEHAPVGIAETDQQGRFLRVNTCMAALTGYNVDELLQLDLYRLTHPAFREQQRELYQQLWAGERASYRLEKRYIRKNGEEFWIEVTCSMVRDAAGHPKYAIRIIRDVSEQKRSMESLRLLIKELNHRVRNNLANVQSLARQAAVGQSDMNQYLGAFEDRLMALSRAHDLLNATQWSGVGLLDLIRGMLKPFGVSDPERFDVRGDDLVVGPETALSLAIVIHELAANAAKYGSLAGPQGRVDIRVMALDHDYQLGWKESDGPAVVPPQHRGFGCRLLDRLIGVQLNGSSQLLFEPDGVRWILAFDPEVVKPHSRPAWKAAADTVL